MDLPWGGLHHPAILICTAVVLIAVSGLSGLVMRNQAVRGQKIATVCTVVGSLMGLAGSTLLLLAGATTAFTVSWTLPFGPCAFAIDPLSALFLLPIFLIPACTSLYACRYWPAAANRGTEPLLTFSSGMLAAAMALVVIARNGILFLMAWEIMALAAGLALTVEHQRREVRQAGTIYLVATHIGTLAIFIMFALLRSATGSFQMPAAGSLSATLPAASAVFLCAFIGFGCKAGFMPFHIWLPSAHANAPSHISALMSGVMLKMGIYGLLRVLSLFDGPPLWWGVMLFGCGTVSALLGIVFAIAQKDLKRLLAYSSIENIGIISMGLGIGIVGLATGQHLTGLLGLAGALLHTLNHSLFKPLLFLGAGALIHAAGTRVTDLMGGLARRMPWTGAFFLVGAAAICALPPLNGFPGELFIYTAFFTNATGSPAPLLALTAPLLALIGGLALLCFVRLYGTALLGQPRCHAAAHSHEPRWQMLAPMGCLAFLCAIVGLVPQLLLRLVLPAAGVVAPKLAEAIGGLAATVPLRWVTIIGIALLVVCTLLALLLRSRLSAKPIAADPTWGCGYLSPAPNMQYTGSSFGETMVRLFATIVRQRVIMAPVAGHFPLRATFHSHCPETVVEQVVRPLCRVADLLFSLCRQMQHGNQQLYIVYMFTALVLLMAWAY